MQSLTFITFMVYKSFQQAQTLDQPKTCKVFSLNTHQSPMIPTVHDLLNVCSNHTKFNYSRQEFKKNTVFISGTPMILKQSLDH